MTEEFGIGYTFKEWRVMAKPEDRKTKFWSTDSDWLWGKLPMPPRQVTLLDCNKNHIALILCQEEVVCVR